MFVSDTLLIRAHQHGFHEKPQFGCDICSNNLRAERRQTPAEEVQARFNVLAQTLANFRVTVTDETIGAVIDDLLDRAGSVESALDDFLKDYEDLRREIAK